MRTEKGKIWSGKTCQVFVTLTEICQIYQIAAFTRLNSSKSSAKFLRLLLHRNAGGLSHRMTQLAIHSSRRGSKEARMLTLTYALSNREPRKDSSPSKSTTQAYTI